MTGIHPFISDLPISVVEINNYMEIIQPVSTYPNRAISKDSK